MKKITNNKILKLLNEGRYDSITNQISSDVFKKWKEDFNQNKKVSVFDNEYDDGNISVDVMAEILFTKGLNSFKVDGGADSESDYLEIRFEIDPEYLPEYWKEISFNLKDVIRHEIEHLTHGEGFNLKPSKFMEDDTLIRQLINKKLLTPAQYFKLEKEVDANLQGMYLRAKKEKREFKDIINTYLSYQDITTKEKKEILDLWSKRAKKLNLPSIF